MNQICEADWLGRWSIYDPDRSAIVDHASGETISYIDMYRRASQAAHYLRSLGVVAGDRVAVLAPNKVETIFLFFALQRLDAILVPINFRLSSPEIDYVLNDCTPRVLLYSECLSKSVRGLTSKIKKLPWTDLEQSKILSSEIEFSGDFESASMILYTSGTTGFPKGAILTNKMLFWNSVNTSMSLDVTKDDVTICFSPLFHTGGWNVLMTPFFHRGAKVIFFEKFEPASILEACETHKVTLLFGVPTTLAMMAGTESFNKTDLSSMRYMIVGGEAMPLELIKIWHNRNILIRQGFGLTEFGPNCFSLNERDAERKMGSIGRPNFYVTPKVVNINGLEVANGEVGELLLKGPCCMQGYWGNPKATNETIQNYWLYTGDLVKQDEEGYFYVVGRKKELFISGGENVYPAEVERVLTKHPAVREAAVIGMPDPKWGEVGHAFVSFTQDQSIPAEELASFCRTSLAGYKVPKHFTFLSELPKGDTGKIQKRNLIETSNKESYQ